MSTSRSFFSSVFVPSFNRLTRAALLLVGFACALAAAGLTARAADIHVPAGGDFQSALHSAQPGDTILLQAGATYVGPFTLPKKVGDAWITVRTSAPDSQLPAPGARATPASSAVMPKLVTPGMNLPALSTAAGAHHYRFVGVEFKPANAAAIVNTLVELGKSGAEQTTLAEVPHHLVFDRCYIHGDPAGTLVRGVALNSAHTDIVNSYISDAKMVGRDTQAICGWNGPGPFKIVNNYLEGAGENVMFGGADSSAASLIPSDIEIRRNHFYKPTSWRGVWTVKNLFELKSARRVVIDGNLFENNWHGAQSGYAILFTVRNQGGTAPWSTVEDVQFTNNVVRHSGGGVNILGKDDLQASQQVARVTIKNNLFEDIDGLNWGGQGNFLIITEARDVTVEHNTVLHGGNITTAYGAASTGFVFRNNLMGHNDYGLFGDAVGYGFPTLNQYFPGAAFERNVIAGAPDWRYPANNFYPASLNDAGFVNRAVGDYRLSAASPYRNAGTDGKDLGCDFDALHAAQSGQPAATPTPTPTPTPAPTATPTPTPAPTATPTPTPTATPTPTPTPAPTPTPTSGGKSREALGRTKKNAQTVSNQLAAAQSSAPPSGPTANVAESTTPQIASIVSELELAYAEFQLDRGLYAPAARIESALVAALEHARAAAASAQQSQLAEVKVKLRRSIDSLELADALMTYGDIQNPIDTPEYFVRQHYVDFLDREPDAAGLSYWVAQITSCGGAPACVEARRINVSAAFFLSIEFQKTGYLVHRVYQAAYGRTPLRAEFGAEAEDVAGGVIVGTPGWESILEANTRDYFDRLARRDDFKARYDALTNEQFVAALLANGGVTLPGNERDALLQELNATGSRAVALRRVVESDALTRKEKNPAFVEMQYFGYMRRDFDPAGFQFWLQKLVNHSGDHVSAQMVKSFLDSGEYRGRFPQR